MNLYTSIKHLPERVNIINSHTLYLEKLAKERGIDVDFKLITSLSNEKRKLYVLYSAGWYYLSDNFILGGGMGNILYSSVKSARVIRYGNQILNI